MLQDANPITCYTCKTGEIIFTICSFLQIAANGKIKLFDPK